MAAVQVAFTWRVARYGVAFTCGTVSVYGLAQIRVG